MDPRYKICYSLLISFPWLSARFTYTFALKSINYFSSCEQQYVISINHPWHLIRIIISRILNIRFSEHRFEYKRYWSLFDQNQLYFFALQFSSRLYSCGSARLKNHSKPVIWFSFIHYSQKQVSHIIYLDLNLLISI